MKLGEIVTYTLSDCGSTIRDQVEKDLSEEKNVVKSVDEARAKIHWRKLLV